MADPSQMELPGMDQPETLELTRHDMILLAQLATTGRDLLRRHLMMNQVPPKEVPKVKATLAQGDTLIERLVEHLTSEQRREPSAH